MNDAGFRFTITPMCECGWILVDREEGKCPTFTCSNPRCAHFGGVITFCVNVTAIDAAERKA